MNKKNIIFIVVLLFIGVWVFFAKEKWWTKNFIKTNAGSGSVAVVSWTWQNVVWNNNFNYKQFISDLEIKLDKDIKNNESEIKIREDRLELAQAYLLNSNQNYDYKDSPNKAINLITTISWYNNDPISLKMLWYANELNWKYSDALDFYKLSFSKFQDNNLKADIVAQIWHVYDLSWDMVNATNYYKKAYELNNLDPKILLHLWVMYSKEGKYKEANEVLYKALDIPWLQNDIKSYIYFQLSSLDLLDQTKSIEERCQKSYENADNSIKSNPWYASAYIWRARALLTCGNTIEEAKKDIEHWLDLYGDLVLWYELLWVYYYDKALYLDAVKYYSIWLEKVDSDTTLMWYEKPVWRSKLKYFVAISYVMNKDKENAKKYLNEYFLSPELVWMWLLINELKKPWYWIFDLLSDDENLKKLFDTLISQ